VSEFELMDYNFKPAIDMLLSATETAWEPTSTHLMDETTPARSERISRPEGVNRLLSRLDSDSTSAWKKHEEIRRRLLKFFEWNRCFFAEELADAALDRVARKLESEEIRDVGSFALAVARYVLLESKKNRRESSVEDCVGGPDSLADTRDREREIVEDIDHQIRLKCLRECLAKLGADDRDLAVGYYSAGETTQTIHRQEIAAKIGITIIALRVRANRVRDKLEKCVNHCLHKRRETLQAAWERGPGV